MIADSLYHMHFLTHLLQIFNKKLSTKFVTVQVGQMIILLSVDMPNRLLEARRAQSLPAKLPRTQW